MLATIHHGIDTHNFTYIADPAGDYMLYYENGFLAENSEEAIPPPLR